MSHSPTPRLRHKLRDIVDARLTVTGHYYFRTSAHRFLAYLQTEFPKVSQLSELRRDPHLLGFLRCLLQQDPPLSPATRRTYLVGLRCLFHDLASQGHSLDPGLILPEDIPQLPRPQQERRITIFPHPPRPHIFEEIFATHIQTLATTLRPNTIRHYRIAVRHFLFYLQTEFPELNRLSELCRDPHLLGYFRYLCQIHPASPLSNYTRLNYLVNLRRLLHDLTSALLPPGLILTEDLPVLPELLPRALSPDDDHRLQQELRRTDDLNSNALMLTRATGIRIAECIDLAVDCLRPLGPDQWALHVPLGKLHTERLVPADVGIRQIVTRILELRALAPPSHLAAGWLLPRPRDAGAVYRTLSHALGEAAQRVGCSQRITCHQLRHTYATELLHLGVSLPALMQLLGHKHINMTLRYLRITQPDLQREFYRAIQNRAQRHSVPQLAVPDTSSLFSSELPGIRQALEATRHLLEMYRRQLQDENARHKLQRLDKRLFRVAFELDHFNQVGK